MEENRLTKKAQKQTTKKKKTGKQTKMILKLINYWGISAEDRPEKKQNR